MENNTVSRDALMDKLETKYLIALQELANILGAIPGKKLIPSVLAAARKLKGGSQ